MWIQSISVFIGLDSTMFDSGQTSHLLRAHCHNMLLDEEFNRAEHRNIQSGCELKRKSGNFQIQAIFLSSVNEKHLDQFVSSFFGMRMFSYLTKIPRK